MNKLTALKQIEEAAEYLESLKTPVTLPRPADMPKDGESYYWIGHGGDEYQCIWNIKHRTDFDLYEYGNYYLTKETAEKAVAKQLATMRVLRKLQELEGDFVVDWSNDFQQKHCVCFDHSSNTFKVNTFQFLQLVPIEWYSTTEAYEYVIENMASDLKLIYGIEL